MSGEQCSEEAANTGREQLESAVFDALDGVYRLPAGEAIETAGLVAGQIAAFLADMAQLSSNDAAVSGARKALSELICDCEELSAEIRRSRSVPPQADLAEPGHGAGGFDRVGDHNITPFKPRSSHLQSRATQT